LKRVAVAANKRASKAPQRPKWVAWWVLASIAGVPTAIFAAVVLSTLSPGARGSSASGAAGALSAYASAMHPLQQEAGQLVAEQIRPSLALLERHRISPEQFRHEAGDWRAELESIRIRWRGLRPPASLAEAARLYDEAMRGYESALDGFVAASRQPSDHLDAAVSSAVPAAEGADRAYDAADALVDAQAKRLGLTPPDPPGPSGS
jgi:hypothetical protein